MKVNELISRLKRWNKNSEVELIVNSKKEVVRIIVIDKVQIAVASFYKPLHKMRKR